MSKQELVNNNTIRADFANALSEMYQQEVPLYKELLELVSQLNDSALSKQNSLQPHHDTTRISCEKHGAIRLGTPEELRNMARLFALMGMFPVGYYDLSVANIPVHSTAFRPIEASALAANPFRIFCSLLRTDLIDSELRHDVDTLLNQRHIFSDTLLELIDTGEAQGGLTESQATLFTTQAVQLFKWHEEACVSQELYQKLSAQSPLLADIAGFKSPHINHLTPRIIDIDQLHQAMIDRGITMIPAIQGPPKRECEILLRQTSFQALSEAVLFKGENNRWIKGEHRARFGEIEQRGIALTPKGRMLYDSLLDKTLSQTNENSSDYIEKLNSNFNEFPDSYKDLLSQKLAFFECHISGEISSKQLGEITKDTSLNELIAQNIITTTPIIYEDFLPISAAGIFKSNLAEKQNQEIDKQNDAQHLLHDALGSEPYNPFALYQQQQDASLKECEAVLGFKLSDA